MHTKCHVIINRALRHLLLIALTALLPASTWAEDYNLWVAGIQVTDANASNVLNFLNEHEEPAVVFDTSKNTLTLNNATINGDIVSKLAGDLTVHLVGTNVIHNGEHAFWMTGNGSLKFTAASGAKLLTDATTDAMFAYSTSSNSAIELGINDLPEGYKLSFDAELKRSIGESYDILIYAFTNGSNNLGPQCITSANCARLAGSYDETNNTWDNETITLSYDYSKTTLTLNNMNLETASPNGTVYFIYCDGSKAKNITVNLLGENMLRQFEGEEGARFIYNGAEDGQITITTDPENPGMLTMPDMEEYLDETNILAMYDGNHVKYQNGLGYVKDENNVRYIKTIPSLGLTVAGVTVNASNAANVLGEVNEETELPTVSFDAKHNTLTLNNAHIEVESEDAIVSSLEYLTVFLIGENYITCYGDRMFNKTSAVDEATITFTTDAVSNGSLSFMCGEEQIFGEGVTPAYTYVTLKDDGDSKTISSNLGIRVGGVNVTLFNADNVLGDETVSFNPAVPATDTTPAVPAILTLNGATIESEEETAGIEYTNEEDLTIALIGNNSIQGSYGCAAIQKLYGVETPKLYFAKGDETKHFSLTLIAGSDDGLIDGFNTDYGSFYVFDDEDDGTYRKTISSSVLGGTGSEDEPYLIKTPEDLKRFADYFNNKVIGTGVYVQLYNDINCENLEEFQPIGDYSNAFAGTFDGNNKAIRNLSVSEVASEEVGLFKYLSENGTVKDLTLDNFTLSGGNSSSNSIGAFVAVMTGGEITNCKLLNKSSISCLTNSQNPTVGGIVGTMSAGIVSNCVVNGSSIKAQTSDEWASGAIANAGGIVGTLIGGTISNCQVKGSTTVLADYANFGSAVAGTIVANKNDGTLTNNYYEYTVTATEKRTTKSGYEQRGIGGTVYNSETEQSESTPDVIVNNGAVLYTKKLTLGHENIVEYGLESYEPLSSYEDGIFYLAPGKETTVMLQPADHYSITSAKLSYGSTEEVLENVGEEGMYEYTFTMPDADATLNVTAEIPGYLGLTVAGVPVTETNASNVLDDFYPSVKYADGTLTLIGCKNSSQGYGYFITIDGLESLNIHFIGYNHVGQSTKKMIDSKSPCTVTFTTDAEMPGQLKYNGTDMKTDNVTIEYGTSGLEMHTNSAEGYIAIEPATETGVAHWGHGALDNNNDDVDYTKKSYLSDYSYWYYSNASEGGDGGNRIIISSSENTPYTARMKSSGSNDIGDIGNLGSLSLQYAWVNSENTSVSVALKSLNGETTYATGNMTGSSNVVTLTPNANVTLNDVCLTFTSDNPFAFTPIAVKTTNLQSPNYHFTTDPAGSSYYSDGSTEYVDFGDESVNSILVAVIPEGLSVSYSSSDEDIATISSEGKITVVGGGEVTLTASNEATEVYSAYSVTLKLKVRPADPIYSLQEGAYYTNEKLTLTNPMKNGTISYSFGWKYEEGTAYDAEAGITLPAGKHDLYAWITCGSEHSYGNNHTVYYVYDQPTISHDSGTYGPMEVEITNLPEGYDNTSTVYYYFDDNESEAVAYTAGSKIAVNESKTLKVYIYVEGDSGKVHKSKVIEREYTISYRTLVIGTDEETCDVKFVGSQNWASYYSNTEDLNVPEGSMAYIVTEVDETSATVAAINYIPQGVPVFIEKVATVTSPHIITPDDELLENNMLEGTDEDTDVKTLGGTVFGLYDDCLMRVNTGMIPAHHAYLPISAAGAPEARRLSLTFENGETTVIDTFEIDGVPNGDKWYSIDGRRLQGKPTKDGIYIKNGKKVVINNK